MPMPVISKEEFDEIDPHKPLPTVLVDSPMAKIDPERARLLNQTMGNPLEAQQAALTEMRLALEQLQARDIADVGYITDETWAKMNDLNKRLSDLHKNMYGTKSLQVSLDANKVTHAAIASAMRKAAGEPEIVDVTPEPVVDEHDDKA